MSNIAYTLCVDNDVYVADVRAFSTPKAMDGSFAECSVKDKPFYCFLLNDSMRNLSTAFYSMNSSVF